MDLPLRRRLRRRFYWVLSWLLLRYAAIVPLGWGRAACIGLARLAVRLRRRERDLAAANLARALPELTADEHRNLLRDSVDHLGRNFFHTLAAERLLTMPGTMIEEIPAGADKRTIAAWLAELATDGRGVLVLTGHIGCWEWAGGWLARTVADAGLGTLGVVTGTIHNPPVDRLIQRQRRKIGLRVLPREQGAAPLVRYLRQGGIVAVLQDQRTRARNRDVPFFGQPAPTPVGLAALARKYGIPVLPIVGVWDEHRQVQVMRHLPPLRPDEIVGEDQLGFLHRCNQALEVFIRRNPEQWVWFHQRWNPER